MIQDTISKINQIDCYNSEKFKVEREGNGGIEKTGQQCKQRDDNALWTLERKIKYRHRWRSKALRGLDRIKAINNENRPTNCRAFRVSLTPCQVVLASSWRAFTDAFSSCNIGVACYFYNWANTNQKAILERSRWPCFWSFGFSSLLPPVALDCRLDQGEGKGDEEAEDEPDVDHLGVRGGGQLLDFAREDGRHH